MTYVGTACWTLYRAHESFPAGSSVLNRYAQRLPAVEINSSFYRQHGPQTYAKWSACTGRRFRFAVKVPQAITHEGRLRRSRAELAAFLAGVRGLEIRHATPRPLARRHVGQVERRMPAHQLDQLRADVPTRADDADGLLLAHA